MNLKDTLREAIITVRFEGKEHKLIALTRLASRYPALKRLPRSLKVVLENLIRHAVSSDESLRTDQSRANNPLQDLLEWDPAKKASTELEFRPARVILQDFTGVPAVVDLAAMRDAVAERGGDPSAVQPGIPVDMVVDHSVQVDAYGQSGSLETNLAIEHRRNAERYRFLKWGQTAFQGLRIVPPSVGIVHQVNLERLAPVYIAQDKDSQRWAFPDTVIGTDSHTTMINGLGVLGWGVGGIEAESVMLGDALSMTLPEVVGVRLTGQLRAGVTATDLVLTVTESLRRLGVVGKFVEFFGPALAALPVADRATLANMAPEYGATCGFFPIDAQTIDYLRLTGRSSERTDFVARCAQEGGLWAEANDPEPSYTQVLDLDLGSISPCLAGPRRPQDRVNLGDVPATFAREMRAFRKDDPETRERDGLRDGAVVIAAITSCTNTSNPSVMLGAGILARKARERGLTRQPWVKTSLAPGSQAVTEYLQRAGLLKSLEELGFHVVGYGCTTCIGNSGPLDGPIVESIRKNDLVAVSVLSGNRNFEGRVNADVKANFLASPPLVVAYAIAGRIDIDLTREPLGIGHDGKNVYLSDIWPSPEEIASLATQAITSEVFSSRYASAMEGDVTWRAIVSPTGSRYEWDRESTYIRCPPYFDGMKDTPPGLSDVKDARILAIVGDSVTTDHISPAGSIKSTSPAARWLKQHGVEPLDFNSYGSRRGNHEVMARGTLASLRLRNAMTPGIEGGVTRLLPEGQKVDIFDAAEVYRERGDSVVLIAGREYGSGSSRDWAAKGPALLGVRAVIAQSFERIHRSNLIGMGIVPLCFPEGQSAASFGLTGEERVSIPGLNSLIQHFQRGQTVEAEFVAPGGKVTRVPLLVRIDTAGEAESLKHGGILQRVARRIIEKTRGKGGKQ